MHWSTWLQVVIAIIGVPLALYGAWAAYKSRKLKRLEWEVTDDDLLMKSTRTRQWSDLSVTFKGAAVKQPRHAIVRVINTGNEPVTPEAFNQPLKVTVKAPATLITAALTLHPVDGGEDQTLDLAAIDANSVTAPPMLLNPRDKLEIRLLIEQDGPFPIVSGRIAGGSVVYTLEAPRTARMLKWTPRITAAFVVLFLGLFAFDFATRRPDRLQMPDVVGLEVADATARLQEISEAREPVLIELDSSESAGTVLQTYPQVGDRLLGAEYVIFVVSR